MAVQVSWAQFQVPAHTNSFPPSYDPALCDPCNRCKCECACPPAPPQCSQRPVRYATGEVVHYATDLTASGFGVPWGHRRSFAGQLGQSANPGNGVNWLAQQWPFLLIQDSGSVAVLGDAYRFLWFDPSGPAAFNPRFSIRQTLILDTANRVYRLYDVDGSVTTFDAATGNFLSHADPAGNQIAVVSTAGNGFNFTEIQRSYTDANGNTTFESYLYSYNDPTAPYPLLTSVLLRRQVNGGTRSNVSQAQYTYYGAGDPNGGLNDLLDSGEK
jgi:hypothetical protein